MRQAGGAGDFDAAVDRMDPRRARIRHDDAGGAEDRQAADDAEAAVEGFRRQRLAAGDRDFDLGIGRARHSLSHFDDGVADHAARHRIDGGLTGRHRKAGPGHSANALAGAKAHAGAALARAHGRANQGPMGDIRIVAGVLDDAGGRGIVVLPCQGERKARPLAARQGHRDRIGEFAGHQRGEGGLGRRRGAGAGGPTPAQRAFLLGHALPFSPARRDRHHGKPRSEP